MTSREKIEVLIGRGVKIPCPETVEIGQEVVADRISGEGVVISPGCRILGASTLIMRGTRIGTEGPVVVEDCLLGPEVILGSGTFRGAVFLKGATAGPGSQIREGCLLEEEAGCAHTVGLKQTILFPFVTLGSLINFCDCLMAGGTSRKNHSEVGSSYIHFNYTPNQDKATPSLIGDVPRGVMMNQPPIFLGGQGGMVGPIRMGFGVVTVAGAILRRDCPEDCWLIAEEKNASTAVPRVPGLYRGISRKVFNNVVFIANLAALRQWYLRVRVLFVGPDFSEELWKGATRVLETSWEERIKRLKELAAKMPESIRLLRATSGEDFSRLAAEQEEFHRSWSRLEASLRERCGAGGDPALFDAFIKKAEEGIENGGRDYVRVIQGLRPEDSSRGTEWLRGIVDGVVGAAVQAVPAFKP